MTKSFVPKKLLILYNSREKQNRGVNKGKNSRDERHKDDLVPR